VRTLVETEAGTMSFQEYFVKHRCEPRVRGLRFDGLEAARPSPLFQEALRRAGLIVFCPSNPFLSIDPILALPGVRDALAVAAAPRVVVSPIIGGQALKGPAAKLIVELRGEEASSLSIARHYVGLATHFILDDSDAQLAPAIEELGLRALVTRTLMTTDEHKLQLARFVCEQTQLSPV
jgi:LPPG:FO 2-phospho-L-lactate transferase